MAYASASPGGYGGGPTVIHTDASHADAVSISDAELLFTGHLERKGPDLFLTGHDGHRHIIPDYFATEHHADLVAPSGARITGDLVDLLAGSPAPGQYAQAQATVPTGAIGRIEKAVGDVTVMRNGVSVALHVGDAVYKNDVVQTGADSSAGIGFPDGTALNLVSNTRMALNDYVYDPNGTSNDALFNLVQGGFAFVAGKVAHTGDMKIGTPVATMGIRGTTGYALQQIAAVNANVGNVTMAFAVVADPGGNGRVGAYVAIDQFGNEVAVDRAGIWTTLSWDGGNTPPTVSRAPMTAANYAIEQALVPALVQILNNINNLNPNPQSGPNNPGSSTPPMFELINLQQYLQQNGGPQQTVNIQTGGSNSNTQTEVSATFTFTPGIPATSVVTWTSPVSGTWETATNWNDLSSPTAPQYVSINQPVKVTVQGSESAYGLRIGAGATLNIASGATLEVSGGIADFGRLQLNSTGSDPTLAINGTVYLLNNGTLALVGPTHENRIIGVAGTAATLVNVNNTITGSGTIGKGDGTLTLVNGKDGTIEATPLLASDTGLLIIDTGNTDSNSGLFAAAAAGMLQIDDAVTNLGFIQAQADSTILIADRIHNRTGTISADGAGANVDLDKAVIHHGTVASRDGGIIATTHGQSTFVDVSIANNSTLETHQASSLDLRGTTTIDGTVTFEGQGRFELHHQAAIVGGSQHAELDNFGTIAGAGTIGGGNPNFVLVNEQSGTIDASGHRALTIDNDSPTTAGAQPSNAVINTGTIEATGSGGLTIANTTISNATDPAHDTGYLNVLAGSHINLDNATILHGFVSIAAGGEFEVVASSELSDATVSGGGQVTVNSGQTLTLDAVTLDNVALSGSFSNPTTLTIVDTVTLNGVTLGGGAIDDTGTLSVSTDSEISHASVDGGGEIAVASDQTLTFDTVALDNVTLSGSFSNAAETLTVENTVTLNSATIAGGIIDDSGTLLVSANSEFQDVTVNGGGAITVASDQTLTFDTVTLENITVTGSFSNAGTTMTTYDAVTLDRAIIAGGTDDLDGATSTVSTDSIIQLATLQNGTMAVAPGQTLMLDGVALDNVTLSGGIDDLDSAFSQVNTDSTIENATLQNGTLAVASDQTLTLDDVTLGSITLSGGTDDLNDTFSMVKTDSMIESATLRDGKLTIASGETLTLRGVTLDNVTLSGGTDDLDRASHESASASQVSTDSTIENATLQDGTLAVMSGQILTLDAVTLGNVVLLGGIEDLDGAISSVSTDSTIQFGTLQNGTLTVASGQMLTLELAALDNVTLSGGTDDLGGAASTVGADSTVENATLQDGMLTVASGQTLTFYGMTFDNVTLSGGTDDFDGGNTSVVNADTTIEYATLQDGTLGVASGQTLTLEAVTLEGVILLGGIDDLNGAASTVSAASTIQFATLQDGTLTIASGQTLTLFGAALDNVTLSGGTDDLDSAFSVVNTDSTIQYATLQDGTLAVASGATLTLDGVTLDGVIMLGGSDNLDSITSTVITDSTIQFATLQDGTLMVAAGQTLTLFGATLDSVTLLGGTDDLDGASSLVRTDSTIQFATLQDGTLAVGSGQTLTLDGMTLDSVVLLGGTDDLGGANSTVTTDSTIQFATLQDGTLTVAAGQTLILDSVTLDHVTLSGGTDDLDGADSTVSTDSTIQFATLQDGTLIVAAGQTLTLKAVTVEADATIDATGILTLATGNPIDNAGLLVALGGGELDVQDSQINNTGTSTGIVVTGTGSELLVDTAMLKLVGGGTVTLGSGGTIVGNGSPGTPDTLENVDNTILGAGTIGDAGNRELALVNDVNGTIAAFGILALATGNTIENAGVLLALGGGELDIQDSQINNTGVGTGIVVAEIGSELLVDTATLKLVGGGIVTLESGTIAGNGGPGTPYTLENVDNSILGAGTIGDAGNGGLALSNDASGTIAAFGVLTFTTGNTIDNAGVLAALRGGELDVQDSQINNTGSGLGGIIVNGAGSELLVDTAALHLVGDGTVTLATGGTIVGNGSSGAPDALENFNNTIVGAGTIGHAGDGELALVNDLNGTIEANGGTLTLDTGNPIVNAGLLQATASSTLDITDNVKGTGNIEIGNGATVELGGIVTNTITFEGNTGTLQIDSFGTSSHYSIFGGGALLPAGDEIYLPNISYDAAADSYNANTGIITVSNGTSAGTVIIDVVGGISYSDTFVFESQGSGTLVYDPPVGTNILDPQARVSATSVSAVGDTFVFHPGVGAETAINFIPTTDTIQLDHFANIQSVQQLTSLIATDAHGDAVIELGHHDSVTLPGISANYLQSHLHSLVHLI